MTDPKLSTAAAAARALADDLRAFDIGTVSGEGFCLSLGEGLSQAHDEFQLLTKSFRAVETVFTGPELETLSVAIGDVRQSVAGLTGGLDGECEAIDALVKVSTTLGTRFELIRRSVRTIAALATNSRVEAASVDSRVGEVSGFAQELVNLAAQAQKAIDGCCREQRTLAGILRASRKTLFEFKHLHATDLSMVERDLVDVGTALIDHRDHIGAAAAALAQRANDIASAIGTIVMALQIGDSTRQRVEHAVDVLAEIPARISDPGEAAAATALACRLAIRQLAGAREDLSAASGQIANSLRRLASEADEIVAMAGNVSRKEGDSLSFIETVRTRLGVALDLSQRSGSARSEVDSAVAEMTRSTGTLDAQMQELSELTLAMTMIGINAILKAKRVGTAGLGLGVIADQLRCAADTVVVEVNEVKPMLGTAIAQTRTLAGTLAGRRGDEMDRRGARVGETLATFASCDAEIGRSIATLMRSGSKVARDLEVAAARPEAERAETAMDGMIDTLEAFAALISDDTRPPDMTAIISTFDQSYTMASERTIHDAFWSAEDQGRGHFRGRAA